MRTRALASALAAAAVVLLISSCSSSGDDAKPAAANKTAAVTAKAAPGAAHYASAQAIADKLKAAGFTVSTLHTSDIDTASLGMESADDFTVTEKPGAAPGGSGINMFRSPESLSAWVVLSKGFGGIAVTGDTWAVSLSTDTDARASSLAMAPHIAQVLGGTVQK